jgi:hypothetical protein
LGIAATRCSARIFAGHHRADELVQKNAPG